MTERDSQGDGLGIDITGALNPKTTYELTAWVRFGDGQETDDVVLSRADTTAGVDGVQDARHVRRREELGVDAGDGLVPGLGG